MNLDATELALLARVKNSDGQRVALTGLGEAEREPAKRLVYLGFLDHIPDHLVLTPAGRQELNGRNPR